MIAASAGCGGVRRLSGTYLELIAVAVPLVAAIMASIDLAAIIMR